MVDLLDQRTLVLLTFRERRNPARHEAIQQIARDEVEARVYDLVVLPEGAEDE